MSNIPFYRAQYDQCVQCAYIQATVCAYIQETYTTAEVVKRNVDRRMKIGSDISQLLCFVFPISTMMTPPSLRACVESEQIKQRWISRGCSNDLGKRHERDKG